MWLKKHWNDPITVGGYTKMCIWSFVASILISAAYVLWYVWYINDWGDRIKSKWNEFKCWFKKDTKETES